MKLEEYAEYFLNKKCNGDIDSAMKRLKNAAEISNAEGDTEAFEMETQAFQHLEVIKSSKVA